jgi:glyoxylase-like metal-dependent hydrolase (beta-lactamase superfamily II)
LKYSPEEVIAIDPCDGSVVLKELEKENLRLTKVLLTHHHYDHTGGVKELKKRTGCEVILKFLQMVKKNTIYLYDIDILTEIL